MLTPIPYQPINFIPVSACESGDCGAQDEQAGCVGGSTVNNYTQIALAADQLQFQFNITICDDAPQLLDNNGFTSGLNDWTTLSDNVTVVDNNAIFGGNDTLAQAGVLTYNLEYFIQIVVTEILDGDLIVSLGALSNSNYTITEAGTYEIYLTASSTNFSLVYEGTGCTVAFVNLYANVTDSDFVVEILDADGVVVAETTSANQNVQGNIAQVNLTWGDILTLDSDLLPFGVYTLNVVQDCGYATQLSMESNAFDYSNHDGKCTIKLSGCNDSRYAFGMDFNDFAPSVRVLGNIGWASWASDRLLYRNSLGRTTNYFSFGEKIEEVRVERLPAYLLEFIASLSWYNNFYVKGVQYNVTQNSVEPIYTDEQPNVGSLVLEVSKRAQNLKQVKCVAPEKSCEPTPNCWDWNLGGTIDWLDSECILLNN